jgi:DNA modification methylase/superfamily II DNA or RNA helicase
MDYLEFLESKVQKIKTIGKFTSISDINDMLFPFQKDVVRWAVKKGRAAVFLDTGLGKTYVQLEWARLIGEKTLILAPLSVARQTSKMAGDISMIVPYVRKQDDVTERVSITNYEMIDQFDMSQFGAVVIDESSILKAIDGKTKTKLTDLCSNIPYRLCCTATPAPNDYTEIGNHVEFLGVCKAVEMLAMFFVNANKEHTFTVDSKIYRKKGSNKNGTEWRLKHHAEQVFFKWMATWSISLTKPSDLGYDDNGFTLPPLTITPHFVKSDYIPVDQLMFTHIGGIKNSAEIRRKTIAARLDLLKTIIKDDDEQWIIWCGLSAESNKVYREFADKGAIEVIGADSPEHKADAFEGFQDGKYRILITKPRIGGFGMNFQNAHKMVFFGLNYSWEQYYQAVRREWRYMQTSPVDVHIIMSDVETEIYENVMRKDALAKVMRAKLIEQITNYEKGELAMSVIEDWGYDTDIVVGKWFTAMLGDSSERINELDENSVDLSVYSPPFADLYTYTDTERDLGNCRNWDEFFSHYKYIIKSVLRVTKPGRLTCVHVSDIPAMAGRDGYIGVRDFPGAVIQAYEAEGWIFTGRAFVQKNPQAQAIRTKAKALLFVQMRKDSADSRPALIDQVLLFKKPGDNDVPITPVANGEMDNETWIEWAHGIWLGISESDTLQYSTARGKDDEKHICPLQIGTIERCIKLYSNPGETVLTPFGGIGSEGYTAVKFGRKAILCELKPEYFNVLVKNMKNAENMNVREDLFSMAGIDVK